MDLNLYPAFEYFLQMKPKWCASSNLTQGHFFPFKRIEMKMIIFSRNEEILRLWFGDLNETKCAYFL